MTNVFIDSDVCIDLLSGRQPFAKPAEILFSLADLGKIKLHVSSLTFSNIDYVLRSQYSSNQSRLTLLKFKTLVHVLTVDCKTIDLAITSDITDFEDAIQYCCALENHLKIIVTRNLKDYKKANILVVNPETFIALEI